ncbi:MAG: hypothetical protein ACTSV1_02360, partial [Alphaproteobacteria bacterium]
MEKHFGTGASNVDFISGQENDSMSKEQLSTFLEIINSDAALKVAARIFGCESAARTVDFIQWVERA